MKLPNSWIPGWLSFVSAPEPRWPVKTLLGCVSREPGPQKSEAVGCHDASRAEGIGSKSRNCTSIQCWLYLKHMSGTSSAACISRTDMSQAHISSLALSPSSTCKYGLAASCVEALRIRLLALQFPTVLPGRKFHLTTLCITHSLLVPEAPGDIGAGTYA